MGVAKTLFGVIVILVAVYYKSIERAWEVFGPLEEQEPLNVNKCRSVQGVAGCEDIAVLGDYAYLACANVESRLKWWPPLQKYDKSDIRKDMAFVYNFKEKTLDELKLENFDGDFILHGISAHPSEDKNKNLLAFINHMRSGNCVELFEHPIGTSKIIHYETVCHPLINNPNDIALLSRKSFYITNYLSSDNDLKIKFEFITQRRWNNIVFRAEDESVMIATEGLSGANGVVLSPTEQFVYAASSFTGEVHMFERQTDGALREVDTVEVDFMPDNLSVDPTTGEIYVTGLTNVLSFLRHIDSPKLHKTPTVVEKIYNTTSQEKFYGKKYSTKRILADNGEIMSGGSIAVVHPGTKTLLVGGILQEGVLICEDIL